MINVIETHTLVKQFGKVTAVDQLSLQVKRGEIYAFLGLNGAGKTTTIRMLLGMIKPTAGEAVVLGNRIRPGEKKPWNAVGYLVETADAYPELTVRQNLEAMRRLRPGCSLHAVADVIDRLGLSEYADRKAGTLSHGNAQRLGLAKALLHQPELLILDEPANGLDPAGIVEIRSLLHELVRDQGVTVFMSSHILAEVAKLAQRIGIIHQGRLLQEMSVVELEQQRRETLLVRTRDLPKTLGLLSQAGFSPVMKDNETLAVSEKTALQQPDQIARLLVEAGFPPLMLLVEQENLEDYFLRLVGMPGGESC